jgi:hypothetical protein
MTGPRKRQRKPITVTVDPRMVQFIDMLVEKGIFWSRSAGSSFLEVSKGNNKGLLDTKRDPDKGAPSPVTSLAVW